MRWTRADQARLTELQRRGPSSGLTQAESVELDELRDKAWYRESMNRLPHWSTVVFTLLVAVLLVAWWVTDSADDVTPPPDIPVLWVCCDSGGCRGVYKAGECPGTSDLYWCSAGESAVGRDGKPTVICHDGE